MAVNNEGKVYAASTSGNPDLPQKSDTPPVGTPPAAPSVPKPPGRGTFRGRTPIGELLIREGSTLQVAMSDPNNVVLLDELKFITGLTIDPLLAGESQVREALDRFYGSTHDVELRKVFKNLGGDSNLELMSDEEEAVDI